MRRLDGSSRQARAASLLDKNKCFVAENPLPSIVYLHFFDKSSAKTRELKKQIDTHGLRLSDVNFDVKAIAFEQAFPEAQGILSDQQAAKLVFIDQCGVDQVTPQAFRTLAASPTCDFLFFLSSSTLHRFYEYPAIKQRIVRPNDYFHVHRAALDYYGL